MHLWLFFSITATTPAVRNLLERQKGILTLLSPTCTWPVWSTNLRQIYHLSESCLSAETKDYGGSYNRVISARVDPQSQGCQIYHIN